MSKTRPALIPLLFSPGKPPAASPVWPATWWDDDEESGLRWAAEAGVGDYQLATSAAAAYAGSAGLLAVTRTTGAAPLDDLTVIQEFVEPAQDYVTFKLFARLPDKTKVSGVQIGLTYFVGGHKWKARIGHSTALNKWVYLRSIGVDGDVTGGGYTWPNNTFIAVSLQLRKSSKLYGTITWPGGSADLSAQGLQDLGAIAGSVMTARLSVITIGAAPATLHTDNHIVVHSPNP